MQVETKVQQIAKLNDAVRQNFSAQKVTFTRTVAELMFLEQLQLVKLVAQFNDFKPDNDPYDEHDFGYIDFKGEKYIWKIDCYDTDYEYASTDPADPAVTKRVLTIMHCSEY